MLQGEEILSQRSQGSEEEEEEEDDDDDDEEEQRSPLPQEQSEDEVPAISRILRRHHVLCICYYGFQFRDFIVCIYHV